MIFHGWFNEQAQQKRNADGAIGTKIVLCLPGSVFVSLPLAVAACIRCLLILYYSYSTFAETAVLTQGSRKDVRSMRPFYGVAIRVAARCRIHMVVDAATSAAPKSNKRYAIHDGW